MVADVCGRRKVLTNLRVDVSFVKSIIDEGDR
jgi:hypothetical protein